MANATRRLPAVRTTIATKIVGLVMVLTLLVTIVSGLVAMGRIQAQGQAHIQAFESEAMVRYELRLRDLTSVATGFLDQYDERVACGELTLDEAKRRAASRISTMRYDDGRGYFWIHTRDPDDPYEPVMVMHPTKPELDGKSIGGFVDMDRFTKLVYKNICYPQSDPAIQNNVKPTQLFVEMNKVCVDEGGGYVRYYWPKPSEGGATEEGYPKLSYVTLFEPWGWVVGSGVYIDDIERDKVAKLAEIREWGMTAIRHTAIILGVCLIGTMCVSLVMSRRLTRPIVKLKEAVGHIAEGNYDKNVEISSRDEIGVLAKAFNTMAEVVRNREAQLKERGANLEVLVAERTSELAETNRGLTREIADRKRAESDLRESQARFEHIVRSSGDWVWEVDANARYTYASGQVQKILGYSPQEIIGKSVVDFMPEEQAKYVIQSTKDAFANKEPLVDLESWHLTKEGKLVCLLTNGVPFLNDNGELLGYRGVDKDITDRKRAEEELRESNFIMVDALEREKQASQELEAAMEKLENAKLGAEAANKSKSEFLANMSHEIRTPMTAILGFTETMLDRDISDSERLNAIHTIRRNGTHLLQIINDILDISKIEAGKLDVECIRCSTLQMVADVQSLMQVRADANNLPFIIEFGGPIPETIMSDPTRVEQILVNLVGNAIKFTETGSVRLVTSFVEADPTGQAGPAEPMLQFEILDTGIGMTKEQASRLFQAFMQADTSTTRKFGGTGLGLNISKRLAEKLGGNIVVESEFGEGSTCRVTVKTGPLDGVRMLDDPASALIEKPELDALKRLEEDRVECRILLAEDGPDNQRLISHILRKAGAEVTVAENGKLAIEAALEAKEAGNPFDTILMDMQMPVMDGYEAAGQLRQRGYTGTIIALTAHAMADDRRKCIEAGCDDYGSKPINRKKLFETIRSYLPPEKLAVKEPVEAAVGEC